MKRSPLLLTFVFVLVAVGGFLLYQYYFTRKPVSHWDLIPDQTVLVYEVGECLECFDAFKSSPPWQLIHSIIFQSEVDSVQKAFDFIRTPKRGELVSLHVTSKDDFDFIFYLPSKHLNEVSSMLDALKKSKGYRASEREFNGQKIYELKVADRVFSWAIVDELWVASFTPFLVEDVIRTFSLGSRSSFLSSVSEVYQLPRIKNDIGNLYVHMPSIVNWLSLFTEKTSQHDWQLGQASLLDVKQTSNNITLNGFSLARNGSVNSLLTLFQGQAPTSFSIKQYISERTIAGLNFGISDGNQLYNRLHISNKKSIRDSINSLVNIDLPSLYGGLGPELAMSYLETKSSSLTKILLFQAKNQNEWLSFFDKLSKAVEQEDTVFYERYSTYEIREIELHNLPEKLFSPLVSGFGVSYYASVGNTIIVADQLESLKSYLSDIDHEEVWGKSVSFNKFLETTLLESTVSCYVNAPLVWSSLSKRLSPKWRDFVIKNQRLLQSFDLSAIQFSYLNESYYTNATFNYHDLNEAKRPESRVITDKIVTNLDVSLLTEPFIIRNHASKQDEIIVQDSLFNVYQISADGRILWKVALEGPITGGVHQIDYYNNGKLQVFFATKKRLHIIDRLGNYVKPFPVVMPSKGVAYSSVVDYDNSKKYRFLITDEAGDLWLFDKDGENLDGWKPRSAGGDLSAPARHYRIRGKDFIIGLRKDGWVNIYNRRGEDVKGFPLNLDARPDGDYYLETGNSLATSYFVLVSRDGFRIKFSLEGKIISRETLIKNSIETNFALINEVNGKSYLIKRQDAKKLVLLDENLREVVSNEFLGKSPVRIRYQDFGSGRVFITVTDLVQDLSYIYDGKGKLLISVPLESMGTAIRPQNSNQSRVITGFEKQISIQSISY